MRSTHSSSRLGLLVGLTLLGSGLLTPALADLPRPGPSENQRNGVLASNHAVASGNRDAVGLARRDPEIAKMIVAARKGESDQTGAVSPNETAVQIALGGQCGFAGCSSSTLVAFTFRSHGANTTTHSILALVTCPSLASQPCQVAPAEIKAQNGSAQK